MSHTMPDSQSKLPSSAPTTLNYSGRLPDRGRLSRSALISPLVGLFSFPLLLHWTASNYLLMISDRIGIQRYVFLSGIAYLWVGIGSAFCGIALGEKKGSLLILIDVHFSYARFRLPPAAAR